MILPIRADCTKALAVALSLAACAIGGNCGTGTACTAIAVPSVILRIVNPQGGVVPVAAATWRVNNVTGGLAECRGDCGDLTLAFEVVGQFDIQVTSPGYSAARLSVTVASDEAGCHPVTQQRTVTLQPDNSVAALAGPWTTTNFLGRTDLRFGEDGKIIGAIVYGQRPGGDRNYYVAYNGRSIRGASGQPIYNETATEPVRNGAAFTFFDVPQGVPVGFENAVMTADFQSLAGTLTGQPVVYTRLSEVPAPLRDP